ncbi:hypothetical protein [Streptomyces sp. NPDC088766]|uniref:hypothetical protein n=1 Tax=Streptomyces sp. NPDC088766 TaxID=3365893 RepID=UPI0037FA1598
MHSIAQTSTATSRLPEQAIVASLNAEIMHDLDDGQPTLIASTHGNQGDLQVVTPTQLLAKVAEQREQLDRIEALANEYAEKVAIPALLTESGIELEEVTLVTLAEINPKVAAAFQAFAGTMDDGTFVVAVPKGQAPAERLATIRALVLDRQKRGQA